MTEKIVRGIKHTSELIVTDAVTAITMGSVTYLSWRPLPLWP
jgi:hypothetical protein